MHVPCTTETAASYRKENKVSLRSIVMYIFVLASACVTERHLKHRRRGKQLGKRMEQNGRHRCTILNLPDEKPSPSLLEDHRRELRAYLFSYLLEAEKPADRRVLFCCLSSDWTRDDLLAWHNTLNDIAAPCYADMRREAIELTMPSRFITCVFVDLVPFVSTTSCVCTSNLYPPPLKHGLHTAQIRTCALHVDVWADRLCEMIEAEGHDEHTAHVLPPAPAATAAVVFSSSTPSSSWSSTMPVYDSYDSAVHRSPSSAAPVFGLPAVSPSHATRPEPRRTYLSTVRKRSWFQLARFFGRVFECRRSRRRERR